MMTATRLPVICLFITFVMLIAYFVDTAPQLPERVPGHFGSGGQPTNWVSKASFVRGMAITAFGAPALIVGLFFILRYMPKDLFNLPHPDFWLGPDRRTETFRFFLQQGSWLGILIACHIGGVYALMVQANRRVPVELNPQSTLYLMIAFLATVVVWVVCTIRPFFRLPPGINPSCPASHEC